jgi:hypothetical protein
MNQKSRSLICTMINQKGGLTQNAEEIKIKAKQDVAAPSDCNKMLFQLKAFLALSKILFGWESITASKLKTFVYKGGLALDKFFPSKSSEQSAPDSNSF